MYSDQRRRYAIGTNIMAELQNQPVESDNGSGANKQRSQLSLVARVFRRKDWVCGMNFPSLAE